jgi:hypothetical protein
MRRRGGGQRGFRGFTVATSCTRRTDVKVLVAVAVVVVVVALLLLWSR